MGVTCGSHAGHMGLMWWVTCGCHLGSHLGIILVVTWGSFGQHGRSLEGNVGVTWVSPGSRLGIMGVTCWGQLPPKLALMTASLGHHMPLTYTPRRRLSKVRTKVRIRVGN